MTAKVLSSGETNYLPSWKDAKDPSDPVLRTCDEDGTHHFTHVKRLGDSGVQYLHAVNTKFKPTRAMLIGTAVHYLVLGPRPDKPVLCFPGEERKGNVWKEFASLNSDADILTLPEWAEAEVIAAAVKRDPVARTFLDEGARFEVPLVWEDGGIKCSTSGVDIVLPGMIGDLKTTNTTEIEALQRQCFKMGYHAQLAFYRRGCRANGIDVSKGMFLLCVETRAPHEVVVLELSDEMIDLGERTVALHLEKLRVFTESNQWPGRAQSPVVWTVPAWMRDDEEDDE